MWPVIGGLLSGLGSIFGSNETNDTNMAIAQQTNQANAQQAQLNRDFQAQMSNTAYQRASADMQAAGLNPSAMFGSGSAASSPAGSTATMVSPRYESPISGIANVVNSTISNAVQMKAMDKMTDEIANLQATKDKIIAETAATKDMAENVRARTGTQYQQTDIARSQSQVMQNAAKTAANQLDINPTIRRLTDMGALLGDNTSKTLGPMLNLISGAKGVQSMFPSTSTVSRSRSFLPDGEMTFEERWGR